MTYLQEPHLLAPTSSKGIVSQQECCRLSGTLQGNLIVEPVSPSVEEAPPPGTASQIGTVANLITMSLGAGMLSLPWTAAGASMLTAAAIAGFVLFIIYYTVMILVEAAEKYNAYDMGKILSHIPGKIGLGMQWFLNISIWASMFLAVVSYLIILSDALMPLVQHLSFHRRALWNMIGGVLMLPLCYVDQKYLSFSSTLCIIANMYLTSIITYYAVSPSWPNHGNVDGEAVCYFGVTRGSISMFNNLFMGLMIQPCVLPTYVSLERRSIPRFRRTLIIALFFVFLLFVGFQTISVLAFGVRVDSNILNALPENAAASIARVSMLLVVIGVCPLIVAPMVAPIHNKAVANLATFAILAAAIVASFFLKELGGINVLNGCISVVGLCTLGPAMVGIFLVNRSKFSMVLLILLGFVSCIVGLIWHDNFVDLLQDRCFL